jgi:hypothetical protein
MAFHGDLPPLYTAEFILFTVYLYAYITMDYIFPLADQEGAGWTPAALPILSIQLSAIS